MRRGAGGTRCFRKSIRIAVAETLMPSLRSSPFTRRSPQCGSLEPTARSRLGSPQRSVAVHGGVVFGMPPTCAGPARDASAAAWPARTSTCQPGGGGRGRRELADRLGRDRPFDLAAQDGDLVPKRQNLKLQFFGRAAVEFDGAHDQPNPRIDGREEHERGPYGSARPVVVARQPRCLRLRPILLRGEGVNGIATDFVCTTPTPYQPDHLSARSFAPS